MKPKKEASNALAENDFYGIQWENWSTTHLRRSVATRGPPLSYLFLDFRLVTAMTNQWINSKQNNYFSYGIDLY